ncbi:secretion/conjugation apparatus DotM-related subunit, partial [Fangia hongkongensis]
IRESFERVFLPHEKKASLLNDKKSLALKPIEYIKYYKLAKSKKIDEIAVSICMQTQLGNKWQNSSNIPWAHYGLFAAFCSYCMKDRQLGENILNLLNKHYSYSGKISKKHSDKQLKLKVERAISQYGASEMIGEKIHRHYYVTTLLVELLFIARQDGSLACSNFLWLKSIDRALWYGLNNLGRKTYFCEGIAIITHWQAEKSLSTRLKTPMLHNVIAALKQE